MFGRAADGNRFPAKLRQFRQSLTIVLALWCCLFLPSGNQVFQGSGTSNDVTLADFN
jgi:hypothetical protein